MSRLPALTGREVVDGRVTVVPIHSGEDLGRGLLAKILRDAKLTDAELRSAL